MTTRSDAMHDPRVAALFRDGPVDASPDLLARTVAVTRRTAQRPAIAAVAARAPRMAPVAGGLPVARWVAIAVLLLVALAVALFAAGMRPIDTRVVVPATNIPTAAASPGPTSTAKRGTVFRIPGTTATFSAALLPGWRLAGDSALTGDRVRIVTAYSISESFDASEVAWVVVTATTDSLEQVQASMVADGWTAPSRAIEVPSLIGVILTDGERRAVDPTALVRWDGVTYRIAAHYSTAAGLGESLLKSFLAIIAPLGAAQAAATYRDDAWGFALIYDAMPIEFLPGMEVGDGVTRFRDAACRASAEFSCDQFVDVVRRSNTSPMQLTLPDGRAVRLNFDPASVGSARLATEWESAVGSSDGYVVEEKQGELIYDVRSQGSCSAYCETIDLRFIHRGEQWLIFISRDRDDAAYNRLRTFLAGFSVLPPG